MKRYLAWALCLLALSSMATPALAGIVGTATGTVHTVTEPVKVRTHKGTIVGNEGSNFGLDRLGGYVDSTYASSVGAALTGVGSVDTTEAVDTSGWPKVQSPVLADTMSSFCNFIVTDATGAACESGADSLYIATQVSADGLTWATAGTFVGGTVATLLSRLDQTNAAGTFNGRLSNNGAALAQGAPIWRVKYKVRGASSNTVVDEAGLQGWRYLRWIVAYPDAKGYIVKMWVEHQSTNESGQE